MAELERPRDGNGFDAEPDSSERRTITVDGGAARVSVPADASDAEVAAVAVAVGAHLSDRQRAAAADTAAAAADRREPTDAWRLADRLGTDGPERWLEVERGEEWRAAARRY